MLDINCPCFLNYARSRSVVEHNLCTILVYYSTTISQSRANNQELRPDFLELFSVLLYSASQTRSSLPKRRSTTDLIQTVGISLRISHHLILLGLFNLYTSTYYYYYYYYYFTHSSPSGFDRVVAMRFGGN